MSLTKLIDDATYEAAYKTIKLNLAAKGERPTGNMDPQHNTTEDTINDQQYQTLMKYLLHSARPECARDRSIFSYLYATVGRADDGRLIFLADMMAPRPVKCIGEAPIEHNQKHAQHMSMHRSACLYTISIYNVPCDST